MLDRLIEKLPGYRGYIDRDARQEADRIQREHVANRIFEQKRPLTELVGELTDNGHLMVLPKVDKVLNRIDKVAQKIRSASYGSAGLFGASHIGETELRRLHEFDAGMVDAADELAALVSDACKNDDDEGKVKESCKALVALLDRIEEHFAGREQIIRTGGPST